MRKLVIALCLILLALAVYFTSLPSNTNTKPLKRHLAPKPSYTIDFDSSSAKGFKVEENQTLKLILKRGEQGSVDLVVSHTPYFNNTLSLLLICYGPAPKFDHWVEIEKDVVDESMWGIENGKLKTYYKKIIEYFPVQLKLKSCYINVCKGLLLRGIFLEEIIKEPAKSNIR